MLEMANGNPDKSGNEIETQEKKTHQKGNEMLKEKLSNFKYLQSFKA